MIILKKIILKKTKFTGAASLLVLSLFYFLVIFPGTASACGWAGDGESDEGDETVWVGADGNPIEEQTNPMDDPKIQTKLGNSHRKAKDYTQAVRWFRMAASQGFEPAQNNLGTMVEKGLGVAKSEIIAAQWFRLAADQGNAKAQHSLGQMYLEGRGVPFDIAKAAEWILKSAENGHVSAMDKIGNMFKEGKGVLKNDIQAYKWWKLSAMHGEETSARSLETAKTTMDTNAIAIAEKIFALAHIPQKKQTGLGLYLTARAAHKKWKRDPDKIIILDIRTLGEYIFVGHGTMAHNIPIKFLSPAQSDQNQGTTLRLNENFVADVKKKFKETDTILVICRSGVRSVITVNLLARAGFKNVYSILDGFEGDKQNNPDSPDNGKRVLNGWKNSNTPWTYDLNPKLMYRP